MTALHQVIALPGTARLLRPFELKGTTVGVVTGGGAACAGLPVPKRAEAAPAPHEDTIDVMVVTLVPSPKVGITKPFPHGGLREDSLFRATKIVQE